MLVQIQEKKAKKTQKKTQMILFQTSFIILVFTGKLRRSQNGKTGPMIQSYIFDSSKLVDEPNIFGAGCSKCPVKKECYVSRDKLAVRKKAVKIIEEIENIGHSPLEVKNIEQIKHFLKNEYVRFGSYGDPSYIPKKILKELFPILSGYTGYTQYWGKPRNEWLKDHFQASVSTYRLEKLALKKGWQPYRFIKKGDKPEVLDSSIRCLYHDKGVQCIDCLLCSGKKPIYEFEH